MQARYAVLGAVVVVFVDLAVNLLAAAIESRSFAVRFSNQSFWLLLGLIAAGLVIGGFLGGRVNVPVQESAQAAGRLGTARTITRLQALLSYTKLRGQGISLSDILLIGSKLDIDTREE